MYLTSAVTVTVYQWYQKLYENEYPKPENQKIVELNQLPLQNATWMPKMLIINCMHSVHDAKT